MDAWTIQRTDGSETVGVEVSSAAQLCGVKRSVVEQWIEDGVVEIALAPTKERLVLVDSLWASLPEAVKG